MMLTLGEYRALRAVKNGEVKRVYRKNGNTFYASGISAAVLWRLANARMIEDGSDRSDGSVTTVSMVLTKMGREVFDKARH